MLTVAAGMKPVTVNCTVLLAMLMVVCCTTVAQRYKQKNFPPQALVGSPFDGSDSPKCHYNGDEGRCLGEVECEALAGNYGTFCPGISGICCLFYRACNQRTSQELSYFRNFNWPLSDRLSTSCSFRVVRRSERYCRLWIQAERINVPAHLGNCGSTFVHVFGTGKSRPMAICTRGVGVSFSVDFSTSSELNLHVFSGTTEPVAWYLKVTQVRCSALQGVAIVGGGAGPGAGWPPAAPAVTTTRRPPSLAPPFIQTSPSTYSTCGVKGVPGRVQRGVQVIDALAAVEDGAEGADNSTFFYFQHNSNNSIPANSNPTININNNSTSLMLRSSATPSCPNPFLQDFTFFGPDLSDTLFMKYRGPESLLTSRITFGTPTGKREYPWQVAMFVGGRYHCGASVIGDWFVLTAAHCVYSYQSNPASVRLSLGDWDLSNNQDGPYIEARVARVRVHPEYSRSTLRNDLAVLKLTQRITFSERVRPICLPTTDLRTSGRQATITGWGRDEHRQLKTRLQELTSQVTSNERCDQAWRFKRAPKNFIVDTMLCMDSAHGDSCNGDSGGPLVMEHPEGSGRYTQVGLVSFGSGSCTDTDLPGVYTRVSAYRNWIRQQMV